MQNRSFIKEMENRSDLLSVPLPQFNSEFINWIVSLASNAP